jgi:ArsR family transcriptional regulator
MSPSDSDTPELVARLAALSDPARLRIMRLLEGHELSVGELAKALQFPQSTLSRHLKPLHEGGWIIRRVEGTASLYRLHAPSLSEDAAALWTLARSQLGDASTFGQDDARLEGVLAERRTDSSDYFGKLGGEWDSVRRDLFGIRFTIEPLLGLISSDLVVADLGCGTGNAAELLAPFVKRVIAVDREPAMLAAARTRLADFQNVVFREGDLLELPLDDGQVTAAISYLVLHHLEAPARAVAEMDRILDTDGVALIIDMVAHNRESYRHTMGHQHLGFDREQVESWTEGTQLKLQQYRPLRADPDAKGPGLFVATLRKSN